MRITYDPRADVLAVELRDVDPERGQEVAPDLVVEVDAQGQVVSIELLNASKHLDGDPLSVSLELLAPEAAPSASHPG